MVSTYRRNNIFLCLQIENFGILAVFPHQFVMGTAFDEVPLFKHIEKPPMEVQTMTQSATDILPSVRARMTAYDVAPSTVTTSRPKSMKNC